MNTAALVVLILVAVPWVLYASAKLTTYGIYMGRQRFLDMESERYGDETTKA